MNRERANVAAGKEQRFHNKGIRGHGQTLAIHVYDCLIIQTRQYRAPKRRQEYVANQRCAQLAAAPVSQKDGVLGGERRRATDSEIYIDNGFRGHALS